MPAHVPGRSSRLAVALACAANVALAAFSPRAIPYCMDEFVHYHALGCAAYPLSAQANAWREACGHYDLTLPFTQTALPLRAYHYIGSLPSLPFLPFWWALRDPVAARVQGAVFLLLACALSAELVGASPGEALLAAFVYPLFPLAFVVDLGPSGLSLLLLLALLLTLRAAARAPSAGGRLALGALAGLVAFLGVWVKLVFAWVLPAALLYGGWLAWREARGVPGAARRHVPAALLCAVCLALPAALLLFAMDEDGRRYFEVVRDGNLSLEARNYYAFLRMGHYYVDGADAIPRTLKLPASALDASPLLLAGGTLALAWHARRRWAGWLLLGLLTLGVTIVTRSAWAPHHVVFSLLFLVLALAAALRELRARWPRAPLLLATLCGLFWLSLALRLPEASVNDDTNAAKDALLRFVRRAGLDARTVQVHTSWGTYYIAHLFGDPAQMVLWINALPDRPEDLVALRGVADRVGRGVLLVTARVPERIDTPALRSALGPPLETRVYENWRAVRYVR